jgi:predicted LPLAT superfamily acyltransferase
MSEKKRGNAFGLFFFKILIRFLGIKSAYSFLYIVCLYYLLFDKRAVLRAQPYVKRRFSSQNRIKLYFHIYKLFISQGMQLIDRYVYVTKPDFFNLRLHESIGIKDIVKNAENGVILLISHIGNWQIGFSTLGFLKIKKLHILMRLEENKSLKNVLNFGKILEKVNIISSNETFGGVLDVVNALQGGGVVSMMGDRCYGAKSIPVKFLGDYADFPISAFHIASTVNCPVVLLSVVKNSSKNYTVHMDKVLYPDKRAFRNKKEMLTAMTKEYVKELEKIVYRYPYQCFLFDDIWRN